MRDRPLHGLLQLTYGSRTYAVGYAYDAQGRLATMTNWSSFGSLAGPRVTTWNYDPYRGWLAGKTYSGGAAGPAYTYTPAGRLQARLWARNLTTTYGYNGVGDLSTVAYSDSTPGLTYTYDRRGRPATVTQGSGATATLAFNDPSQLLTESYSGTHPLAGLTVTNTYDQYLRRTQLSLNTQPSALNVSYGYDTASRLHTVTDNSGARPFSATYSYLANSPLVQQIGFASNGITRMTTTKQYDFLNRLTQVSSLPSQGSTLSSAYAYNPANQRTNLALADSSYWVYGYDSLGQVTSGKKYWTDGSPVAGQQFQYQFDDIGNRQTTDAGGDQNGANLRHVNYTPDTAGLNQYASRDVPGYVQTLGTAGASANVSLWSTNSAYALASRKGTYFRAELPVNNANGPVWAQLTNVALVPGGSSADVLSSAAGNLFVPKTAEQFTYDPDGNLLTDGRWTYTWDAENRLINMTSLSAAPSASKLKLDFTYDYKGRRVQKTVSTWNGSQYVVQSTRLFAYDGWNLLAALNSPSSVLQSFLWGLDLSGTPQGAGGVGGLLEVNDSANGVHFAAFDGNGNVAGLVKAVDGTTSAVYEYGPFAELLRATGPMAKANPLRFSTKFQDDETDLVYYAYRYYNPSTGRWLSRDSVTDLGFRRSGIGVGRKPKTGKRQRALADSYVMSRNNVVSRWDYLGLEDVSPNLPCPASEDGMDWTGKAGFGGVMRCLYKKCTSGTTSYTIETTYGDWVVTDEHWEEDLGCLQSKCRTYTEALYAVTGCGCRSRIVYYQFTPPSELGPRIKQLDFSQGTIQKTLAGGPWSGTSCTEGLVDKTEEECGKN